MNVFPSRNRFLFWVPALPIQESRIDEIVLKVFAEAVRMGFPVYVFKVAPGKLVVVTETGRALFSVRELEDPISGGVSIAVSLGMEYGAVVLAEPEGGVWKLYPERVPDAVALEPMLLSRFEADAWSRRISLLSKGSYDLIDLRVEGFKAALLETGWEAAVIYEPLGLAVAWVNCLTGSRFVPLKWQVRMGLIKGEYEWLKRLAEEAASRAIEMGACSLADRLKNKLI